MKKFKERRRCKRYKILNSPSVMIYPERVLSFSVLDDSDTGLAFSYIGGENCQKDNWRRYIERVATN